MRLRNAGSARCRDRLEQLERKRERERKLREQQKEQREQKERERRAEERRKEREARREGARAGGGLALSRSRGECWCLGRSRHPGAEPRPGSGLLGGGGRQAGRAGSGRGQWLVWGVRRSCPQGVAQGHLRPSAGPLLRVPCAGCPLAPGHLPAEAVLGLPFLTNRGQSGSRVHSQPPGWSCSSLASWFLPWVLLATVCPVAVPALSRGLSPSAWVRVRGDRGGPVGKRVLPAPCPLLSCAPGSAHHRTTREDYSDKVKASHWSRSPLRPPRERFELGDGRKPGEAGRGSLGPCACVFVVFTESGVLSASCHRTGTSGVDRVTRLSAKMVVAGPLGRFPPSVRARAVLLQTELRPRVRWSVWSRSC